MNRIEQYACLILVLGIIASSLTYAHPVFAQPTQASYTVNLTYLTVQLSYPSEVMPGDSVTVNLQATTKSYVDSISLTTQVLYADNGSLHQLASATVSNNNNYYANSSSTLSKQIQFTVPQDAPRTSLVAALTEKIQSTSYSYYPAYYYPAYYDSSSPNCYYYPDYWSYDYGYCTYYGTAYGFPSYSYNAGLGRRRRTFVIHQSHNARICFPSVGVSDGSAAASSKPNSESAAPEHYCTEGCDHRQLEPATQLKSNHDWHVRTCGRGTRRGRDRSFHSLPG